MVFFLGTLKRAIQYGKKISNLCSHVISFRITETDRKNLDELAERHNKSVSEIMRGILLQINNSLEGTLQ